MNEQSSKEAILQKTLYVLVRRVGLTPKEASMLRLSDLHLAGKNPNITYTSAKDDSPKTVELDLETHRALVGWLVVRPDSASELLFLGDDYSDPMDVLEIEQAIEAFEQVDLDLESKPVKPDATEASLEPETPPADEDPPVESATGGASIANSAEPDSLPAKSRSSTPPLSTPEMGAPPPGFEAARPLTSVPRPPPSAPEEDVLADEPEPLPGQPFVPKKPRVPPKPVRKKDADGTPVIVQQKGADQGGAGEAATPAQPVNAEETQVARLQRPLPKREVKHYKLRQPSDLFRIRPGTGRPAILSFVLGGGLIFLSLCVICVGGTGWFALQSETGGELLAGLGFFQTELEDGPTVTPQAVVTIVISTEEPPVSPVFESPVSPVDSPLATPTLPPTNTPTPLPPTNTPLPTETASPILEVEQPPPTDIPVPTDTPIPLDTPTPEPPPATPIPADTPTPETPPTPAMKYQAPVLLEPKNDFGFIAGNTVVLRWQPVVELAPDEQYAVRMIYTFHNKVTYQGGQTKSAEWVVPISLYGQIDPPENRYEWFVVVERLNNDGSGTAISPESERWTFTWK